MAIVACGGCGTKNRVDEGAAAGRRPVCGRCGRPLAELERPETVTDLTFQAAVLDARGAPVLVDFWAAWCGPCRMIAPTLDQLAAEANGRYRVAKLNVDENPRAAAQFGVQSIPTLIIFRDGRAVDRIVGVQSKQHIAARLAAQV